jgi:hypothetical protein
MSVTIEGTLEIDANRGVIYFHSRHTQIPTLLRIQGLPTPIPASDRHRNKVLEMLDLHFTGHCSWQGERTYPCPFCVVFSTTNEGEYIKHLVEDHKDVTHVNYVRDATAIMATDQSQPDSDRVVETYERIGGEEKDRCPYCQAKINFDGSYWPTTSGNFCSKDHFASWQEQQERKNYQSQFTDSNVGED